MARTVVVVVVSTLQRKPPLRVTVVTVVTCAVGILSLLLTAVVVVAVRTLTPVSTYARSRHPKLVNNGVIVVMIVTALHSARRRFLREKSLY
jgi:hypothetical protein